MPQSPDLEKYPHLAPKQHASYDEKPQVQLINESLTDAHPTGYVPHGTHFDLDKAQLDTIDPANTEAYNEAKNRVENDGAFHDGSGTDREGWDHGFSQEGDPYGIGEEYLTQSPNPNSAYRPVENLPTQADADATMNTPGIAPERRDFPEDQPNTESI